MLEIFTVGGGEYIVNVLNAVAAWTGGGGYKALLRVVMVMGFITALLSTAWNMDFRLLFKWFVSATGMYMVLMVPTTSVKVTDRTNPGLAPAVVANVPIGLAGMAHFTSQVGDWLTREAETLFAMPNVLDYSNGGMIYGAKLMDATQNQQIRDVRLATNVDEYMRSCLFYDILIYGKDIQALVDSPDLLQAIGPGAPSLAMTYREASGNRAIKSCDVAYTQVVADMNKEYPKTAQEQAQRMYPDLGSAAALAKFNADIGSVGLAGLGSGMTSAQQLTTQAMMIDALLKARANFGNSSAQAAVDTFAQQRAELQTRATYSTIAGQAMKWVPLLNVVLTTVFYAMFPIIFLLMLMPSGGIQVARGYLMGFFYLASWGPLFVVLNMIFMSRWQASLATWHAGGLTAANFTPISEINQDTGVLAGYMIMSVPFIAAGMAKGAMAIASHSTSFLAPSQSAAEQAAAESSTGNYAYGNVSMANRTRNTTTFDQHRTAPSFDTGAMISHVRNSDGTTTTTTADGRNVYDVGGGMSNLAIKPSLSNDYRQEQREVLARGQEVVESRRQAETKAWTATASQGAQLLETTQQAISSGRESSQGVRYAMNEANSVMDGWSSQMQRQFGFDKSFSDQVARSMWSGASADIAFDLAASTPGGLGLALGGKLIGQARNGTDSRRESAESFKSSEGYKDFQDWSERASNSQEAQKSRDTMMRATSTSTDSQIVSGQQRYDASLSESRSASLEASRAESAFDRYSKEISSASQDSLRFDQNLAQEFTEFSDEFMRRPENAMLRGANWRPNLANPNAEQAQVGSIVWEAFKQDKLAKMRAEFEPLTPAERTIAAPDVGGVSGVQSFGAANMEAVSGRAPNVNIRDSSFNSKLAGDVAGQLETGKAESEDRREALTRVKGNSQVQANGLAEEVQGNISASLWDTLPLFGSNREMEGFGVFGDARRSEGQSSGISGSSLLQNLPVIGTAAALVDGALSSEAGQALTGRFSQAFGGGGDARPAAAAAGLGIKSRGVNISNLAPQMSPVLGVVSGVADDLGLGKRVITSGNDGTHGKGSLHYSDRALDFRGRDLSVAQGRQWAAGVGRRLGSDYDVKFEVFPNEPTRNHLHVEYDPKGKK